MLVRDTPVAIDVAQSHCQPEQEPSFFRRVAERAGAAPHDGDGDGNIFAGGNCKLVEREGQVSMTRAACPFRVNLVVLAAR